MKVLVTGGAGFVGSHVCEVAITAGMEVAVLDNLSSGRRSNVPDEARLYVVDLRNAEAVRRVIEDFGPDAVSHQAAQASVAASVRDPTLDVATNVLGSVHLLEACAAHEVERLVFASTGGAIYGEVATGERADVERPAQPWTPYAASKLAVEGYLRFYAERGLRSHVLRYANVYGPRQDPYGEAGVVAIFIERLLGGRPVQINARRTRGDDGCVRDYVFVEDVARINLEALRGGVEQGTLNLGTGRGTSTRALLRHLIEGLNPEFEARGLRAPIIRDAERRAGDLERSVLDVEPFVARFGPPVALEQGLARTLERWLRPDGARPRLASDEG